MNTKYVNWQDLTPEQVTNYYLFGQENKPSSEELVDEKWIHRTTDLTVRIQNINSYMTDGPGRFANASQIELIKNFFNFPHFTEYKEESLKDSYTFTLDEAKLFFGDNTSQRIQQSRYVDGVLLSDEYLSRVYTYETQAYSINDNAIFIVEKNINGEFELKGTGYFKVQNSYNKT